MLLGRVKEEDLKGKRRLTRIHANNLNNKDLTEWTDGPLTTQNTSSLRR